MDYQPKKCISLDTGCLKNRQLHPSVTPPQLQGGCNCNFSALQVFENIELHPVTKGVTHTRVTLPGYIYIPRCNWCN